MSVRRWLAGLLCPDMAEAERDRDSLVRRIKDLGHHGRGVPGVVTLTTWLLDDRGGGLFAAVDRAKVETGVSTPRWSDSEPGPRKVLYYSTAGEEGPVCLSWPGTPQQVSRSREDLLMEIAKRLEGKSPDEIRAAVKADIDAAFARGQRP